MRAASKFNQSHRVKIKVTPKENFFATCLRLFSAFRGFVDNIKIFCEINFETKDSDINFILLQRRFDASFSS
jgi:hypothetical protein